MVSVFGSYRPFSLVYSPFSFAWLANSETFTGSTPVICRRKFTEACCPGVSCCPSIALVSILPVPGLPAFRTLARRAFSASAASAFAALRIMSARSPSCCRAASGAVNPSNPALYSEKNAATFCVACSPSAAGSSTCKARFSSPSLRPFCSPAATRIAAVSLPKPPSFSEEISSVRPSPCWIVTLVVPSALRIRRICTRLSVPSSAV